MATYVVLDSIRSAHNVGSIFRSADGAGVSKLYLCGCTPTPVDRFGRTVPEIAKTSLGAADAVPWVYCSTVAEAVVMLRSEGVQIVVVEQHECSIDYRSLTLCGDTAYVFGNEIDGVSPGVCAAADAVVHIPMYGTKESLNVSVAAGIVLFHVIP